MYQNEEHKQSFEERGDGYEYIGTYRCDEMTMDGKNKKGKSNYIRIKCPYCDNEYDIQLFLLWFALFPITIPGKIVYFIQAIFAVVIFI